MIRPLVVGLGSFHGDDQAGWLVLDRLREHHYPDKNLIRLQHPAELLDVIEVNQPLIVCDACLARETSDSVNCWRWPTDRLEDHRMPGTHDLSLVEVLQLGKQLESLPDWVEMWAIKGANWTAGAEPSNLIHAAAIQVADAIWKSCDHA